jgi:hypothetical protein
MSVNDEAAKFSQEVQAGALRQQQETRKALAEAAARGHLLPPGSVQEDILEMSQEVKRQLTKANADIYKEELGQLHREEEVQQKVFLGMLTIELKEYRARLENSLAIERAGAELDLDRRRAALDILESQIKARQAAIIMEHARIEAEINYWRKLQVEAEGISLGAEIELIEAKVQTAQMQATIIPYLYQLIDAEYLVLAAEQRRAAILPLVIEAQKQVAVTKVEMIPWHLQKAQARLDQADMITREADWKRQIELLGYRRLDLKEADEVAKHQLRLQEVIQNQTHLEYIRADRLLALTKQQASTALTEYQVVLKNELIEWGKQLEQDEKGYRLELRHFFTGLAMLHEIIALELEKNLFSQDLSVKLNTINEGALSDYSTLMASAFRFVKRRSNIGQRMYISKGD